MLIELLMTAAVILPPTGTVFYLERKRKKATPSASSTTRTRYRTTVKVWPPSIEVEYASEDAPAAIPAGADGPAALPPA
jgi:hypothetical protein